MPDKEQSMTSLSPARLYILQLSTTSLPIPSGTLEMATGCYLVQMNDGKNILIDTGLPADYVPPPGTPPSANRTNMIAQLSGLGLQPDNIDILICSHFDPDHAGYNDAFPKAELVVQRKHYELARSGHPRYATARHH